MEIQILSDLHLESPKAYDIFDIVPTAPYLALLGDVGNVVQHEADYMAFLARHLARFRAILFVPGNHEAYHSDWPTTLATLRRFEETFAADGTVGDFVLLDRGAYRVPEQHTRGRPVTVLGCSLFSSVPAECRDDVGMGLNDFLFSGDWDVDAHNQAHARDLAWLNAQVSALEEESHDEPPSQEAAAAPQTVVVILTHWSPTRDARAADPRHAHSRISSAFATDLSAERCFASPLTRLWAFGHTHFNCDFALDRAAPGSPPLRLLANQRGYYFAQAQAFDESKVVEI